jgi:hypothetical protein
MFKHKSPDSLILKDNKIIHNFLAQIYFIKKGYVVVAKHWHDFLFLCNKNEFLEAENWKS